MDGKERLDRTAGAEDGCAKGVLLLAVIGNETAGECQECHGQPHLPVITTSAPEGHGAEQDLGQIDQRLSDQEEDETLLGGFPAFAAVHNNDNGKDDPPFHHDANVLEGASS